MRIAYLVFCLIVVTAGALFGALNPLPVTVDFYLAAFELRLGLGLLLAALAGAALGGLCVWLGVVLPLRRRLRRLQRDEAAQARTPLPAPTDESAA